MVNDEVDDISRLNVGTAYRASRIGKSTLMLGLYAHLKAVQPFVHEASNAAEKFNDALTIGFDEVSKFRILCLTEPLRAEELKPFLINPKNKPFYRQFEGSKKWKF